jgi:hypothetical protein
LAAARNSLAPPHATVLLRRRRPRHPRVRAPPPTAGLRARRRHAANQQSQVGVMEPRRGRGRPPWRDASGAGDLWRLCQAVYMATIPTWPGGVGGAAIPTSGVVGGCVARWPAASRAVLAEQRRGCMRCPNTHDPPCTATGHKGQSRVNAPVEGRRALAKRTPSQDRRRGAMGVRRIDYRQSNSGRRGWMPQRELHGHTGELATVMINTM